MATWCQAKNTHLPLVLATATVNTGRLEGSMPASGSRNIRWQFKALVLEKKKHLQRRRLACPMLMASQRIQQCPLNYLLVLNTYMRVQNLTGAKVPAEVSLTCRCILNSIPKLPTTTIRRPCLALLTTSATDRNPQGTVIGLSIGTTRSCSTRSKTTMARDSSGSSRPDLRPMYAHVIMSDNGRFCFDEDQTFWASKPHPSICACSQYERRITVQISQK